jgi:hypothetical protein
LISPAMSQVVLSPAVEQRPQGGYFQQSRPVTTILASFLALTLPMCILGLTHPDLVQRYYIKAIYLWLLGVTHFVITLTIYFQSANLRYFNTTWKNRAVYFLVPIGILVFFDVYAALDLSIQWPVFNIVLVGAIRLFENVHVCRQSYGVTQLFKRRCGQPYYSWVRNLEHYYFLAVMLMLWFTFLSGGFDAHNADLTLGALIAGSMFLALVVSHGLTWYKTRDRGVAATLAYLMFQSASAALAMYDTSLYIFCLTMHYVEYHVLMAPRCFDVRLDPGSRTDRLFGLVQANRVLFYAILVIVAGVANLMIISTMGTYVTRSWATWPTPARLMLALFNGLFVTHYFVEAFIWKFSDPFYRQSLLPLYFSPSARQQSIPAVPSAMA